MECGMDALSHLRRERLELSWVGSCELGEQRHLVSGWGHQGGGWQLTRGVQAHDVLGQDGSGAMNKHVSV